MSTITNEHFETESLERFEAELSAADFTMVESDGHRYWIGPIHAAFASLTGATEMIVVIRPGWPITSPALLVDGLDTNHSTRGGFVCMWQDDETSREWTTVAGLSARIEEWCDRARNGWENDALWQDAFLNFTPKLRTVATIDHHEVATIAGAYGEFRGTVNADLSRVDIEPGKQRSPNHLRGLWFHAGAMATPPPRGPTEAKRYLSRNQTRLYAIQAA